MTLKLIISNNPLKRGILLLIPFLLIVCSTFSQTTKDTSVVCIPRLQAVKIAQDLQSYKDLKQIDSIRFNTINLYQQQISLKDTTISLLNLKVTYFQHLNDDLIKTDSLHQDETKEYIKQNKVLKVERDGIAAFAFIAIVKLVFFK